jgi:hypothetical protein
MQGRAMALMGKKLTAAQALEGTFSTEGIVAMAGEDANVEIALARSLVERMDEGDARRAWGKVHNARADRQGDTIHDLVLVTEPNTEAIGDRRLDLFALVPAEVAIGKPRRRARVLCGASAGAGRHSLQDMGWLF